MSNSKGNKTKLIIFIIIVVLPFLIVYSRLIDEWVARIIAVSIFYVVFNIIVIIYSLNPKSKIISDKAKLSLPSYENIKKNVTIISRGLGLLLGVGIFFYFTRPVIKDVEYILQGERPLKIISEVKDNSIPLFGLWFLNQNISIKDGTSVKKIYFMFSLEPRIRKGALYEFEFLRYSKIVVKSKKLKVKSY